MKFLISKNSRDRLFGYLMEENLCKSFRDLSKKMKIPYGTIQKWRYNFKAYLPHKIIPKKLLNKIKILDKQEDNWGQIKGGQKTFKVLLEKYGKEEFKRRQRNGGRIASRTINQQREKELNLDISNPLFLEFYGAMLGDGWLSQLKFRDKIIYLVGVSGNAKLDRDYFNYLKKNIRVLFNRSAYIKERPKYNSIEINFSHKFLINKFNTILKFPIGEKKDLVINETIYNQGYEKLKYVIRGIFDTDGCFFFDKTPAKKPYPRISIKMKAPKLIKQLVDTLIKQGFKVYHDKSNTPIEQIRLKGSIQLKKWMEEIGSSNPRNYNKMLPWRNPDSAEAS